jgi:hypothetical protein
MKVWRVTLNVPTRAVGYSYDSFDVSAPSAIAAVLKAKKHQNADGQGRPYVAAVVEIADPE